MNTPHLQLQLPLRDPALGKSSERLFTGSWCRKSEEIETALCAAGYAPGWGWEETMFSVLSAIVFPMPRSKNVILVRPKDIGCPYGEHERARTVMEYATGRDLWPLHPFMALDYLHHLRVLRPDECRGVMVLCTGGWLKSASGRPFLITAHHTNGRSWLSPLFTDGVGGATQYQDRWLFATP